MAFPRRGLSPAATGISWSSAAPRALCTSFGDHGDRLEYSCPETGGKTVEMNDLPQPDTMPIDAWIAACCGQGQAPNGIDEAVALTQFMVGAYESYRTGQKYTFPSAN